MNDNTVVGDDGDLEAIKEKALLIVTNAIQGATDAVGNLQKEEAGAKYEVPNIAWMKCQDFTIGKGLLQIEEYMRTLPVEVFFIVETNKLIHRPGKSRFKEKWLKEVIESKISLMETIYF
uniref:A-kinase anchor protein 14 isoform X2 n=1 Tax=Pogona vitticeps TaxID=103695 RepID=A0ABM5EVT7_9SAUR